MKGILLAKIKWLLRNPWTFIIMTVMSILFALIVGESNIGKVTIPASKTGKIDPVLISILEDNNLFAYEWMSEKEMKEIIANGRKEFGLNLMTDDFEMMVGIDSHHVNLLEQAVQHAYKKNNQLELLVEINDEEHKLDLYRKITTDPIFAVETTTFHGEDAFVYDHQLRPLFGFSLFFVIMTISYSVFQMLIEKKSGVWDRMILSPLKKWEMYVANLVYSFIVGYLQVIIVLFVFRYLVKIDFHGAFILSVIMIIPYVLSIVSLAIFITGVVKTVQQFNAAIPIVSVSMAMIGGAYWPLEIVESKIMITLSKFMPLTYGMEVLNGVTTYGYGMDELLYPTSILLLMSVIFTGLGIHLMEKRYVS